MDPWSAILRGRTGEIWSDIAAVGPERGCLGEYEVANVQLRTASPYRPSPQVWRWSSQSSIDLVASRPWVDPRAELSRERGSGLALRRFGAYLVRESQLSQANPRMLAAP